MNRTKDVEPNPRSSIYLNKLKQSKAKNKLPQTNMFCTLDSMIFHMNATKNKIFSMSNKCNVCKLI